MFKVYSSSAGSGKTYTLTKEYLKLALQADSDTYFRSILAVTFTNAAASEMKERIMTMLRAFSSPEGQKHPMLRDLVTELYPGIADDSDLFAQTLELYRIRSQKLFRKILHRYSDFSVMTIDKFTQRLVSSFTDELGIPFAFETQVDSDQLANAVDRMLARIGQEGEAILTEVVETYYRESAEEGKSWGSLPHRIRKAAYDLLNEKSYLAMQKVKDLTMSDWIGIRGKMKQTLDSITQDTYCKVLAREAVALVQQNGLETSDFAGGQRGIIGHFQKFNPDIEDNEEWWEKLATDSVIKNLEEDKWNGSKATKANQARIGEIKGKLEELYHCILSHQTQQRERYFLFKQIEKHLYNLSLLGEIRKEFDALLKQGNQVHISDFNRKVLEIVAREPVPFIFERLGEKYNHILVDEFQDTSKLQFANLLPLIDNALGFGHFNLIVGDAKQSIYRFRGGDMDLILHLSKNQIGQLAGILGDSPFTEERLFGVESNLEVAHLRTNRRSFREVTTFNNGFFRQIADSVQHENPSVGQVFDEHFQQEMTADVRTHGHIQIEFINIFQEQEETDTNPVDPMVQRTLELVDELRVKGYDWRDVAILCRKKTEAAAIAGALKERGTPLISDDSLLLTYSQTVNLLVSFMQVLQTPDHALARYEAAYLFHRVILAKIPDSAQHEQIRRMCNERDTGSFLHYFEAFEVNLSAFRLRQLGVYELCEKLITSFKLFDAQVEGPYLFRFMDAILEFGTRRSNHLADFLAYWETAKAKISITVPANADALRITTIHKSKGLEYPVVIVPNCDWQFTSNPTRDRIWVDMEHVDAPELTIESGVPDEEIVVRRLNSSVVSVVKELSETALAPDYADELTRTLLENLNLLYVAFTRPVQRLYILAKNSENWNSSKSKNAVNRWLYDYLNSPASPVPWNPTQSQYILWEGQGDIFHSHAKGDALGFPLQTIISTDRTDRLRLRRMADRIFDVETFEKKKDRLQKMRYALSLIGTQQDIPKVVRQLTTEGIVEASEAGRLQGTLAELLNLESLSPYFAPNAKIRLKREFLLPKGKILIADRLVSLPDGSEALMNVVAGTGSDDSRRQLGRALQAYQSMGHPLCRGHSSPLRIRRWNGWSSGGILGPGVFLYQKIGTIHVN
ncbi:UvrD-helicase domain-containing protein [Salmonirosea aquatica]|uniref:UvrD-helicase domain-containing protein n=1 Tax=Salmonirosea aquatica TaxID=2654236 RepID=UPI0035710C5D